MTLSFDFVRRLLGRKPAAPDRSSQPVVGEAPRAEERPSTEATAAHQPVVSERSASRGGNREDRTYPPELSRVVSTYFNARADEMLAVLLDGLTREATRELGRAVETSRQSLSAEIGEVKDGVTSSQREFSRLGRELVRSGATLESIQSAVAALGPTVERLESSLVTELLRERQRHDETGLDEVLATLDGLEAGLAEGREVVKGIADAHRRLKDTTVQRWWRAMGEATGVKRPLPEVPLADAESLIDGLELTYRRLQDTLARRGITPIAALGEPFDPYVHEAVGVEPCAETQDGLIVREQRRGYRTPDRVIRLSQVIVGRGEPAKPSNKRSRPRLVQVDRLAEAPEPETEDGGEGTNGRRFSSK